MSLYEFPDVDQGSERWHDLRRGMVTASVVGTLITPSTIKPASNVQTRALTALLASERITGWTENTYASDDMERGWEDEPRAVEAYGEHHDPVTPMGFMIRDDWGFQIGYSPDGLVEDRGAIEIKSRQPKKHLQTILANEVPSENMAQIQCALLVSGRAWVDYVSYCGGMPLWVKRVRALPKWQDAILRAVADLEQAVEDMQHRYRFLVDGLPMTERVDDYYPELRLQ